MVLTHYKTADNAQGQLFIGIDSLDTAVVLYAGQGAKFPSEYPQLCTLEKFDVDGLVTGRERVVVTNRSGDTFTITRGFGGDTPLEFDADDYFSLYPVSAIPEDMYAELIRLNNDKAEDDEVVHLAGDESIGGEKTFTTFPITPSAAPDANYEVANKKYVDDTVASSLLIETFEAERTMGEDLAINKAYFVGQGGDTIDSTGGTPTFQLMGDTAGNLDVDVELLPDDEYTVLRKITSFRVDTQGSPASDLTVYAKDALGNSVLLVSTTDLSLTLNADITIDCNYDAKYLRFVCTGADASNYYKVKVNQEPVAFTESDDTQYNTAISAMSGGTWVAVNNITITNLTVIDEFTFQFQSSFASYGSEMSWQVKKNGGVVSGPTANTGGDNTDWHTLSVTGLALACVPGDTITLEVTTSLVSGSSQTYRTKEFDAVGTEPIDYVYGVGEWGYEATKKYLADASIPSRASFFGIELVGGSEDDVTKGAELGKYILASPLNGGIYLSTAGNWTTTPGDIYIGRAYETELYITNDRGPAQDNANARVVEANFTFDDIAQSDVVIPHGLPRPPVAVLGTCNGYAGDGNSSYVGGHAGYDGSSWTQKVYNTDTDTYRTAVLSYAPASSSDRGQWAISSVDETNVTLSYTYAGTFSTVTVPCTLLFIC